MEWDHDVALLVHDFLDCPDAMCLRLVCRSARDRTRARIFDSQTSLMIRVDPSALAGLRALYLAGTVWSPQRWAHLQTTLRHVAHGLCDVDVSFTNLGLECLGGFPSGLVRLMAANLHDLALRSATDTAAILKKLVEEDYPGLRGLSLRYNDLIILPDATAALLAAVHDLNLWGNIVHFHPTQVAAPKAFSCQQAFPPGVVPTDLLEAERGAAVLAPTLTQLRVPTMPASWPANVREVRIDGMSIEQQIQMWQNMPMSVRVLWIECYGPIVSRPLFASAMPRRVMDSVVILGTPCISALDRVSGLQTLALRQALHLGDLDIRNHAATLTDLDLSFSWPQRVDGIDACETLASINTRGWRRGRVQALRDFVRFPEKIRTWFTSQDVAGVARSCSRLERLFAPFSITAARYAKRLRVWDMSNAGLSRSDVLALLKLLGEGACPHLRVWNMENNPGIGPTPWETMGAHMEKRHPSARARLQVLRVMHTGMDMDGFAALLRGVRGLGLALLTALDAQVDMDGIEFALVELLQSPDAPPAEIRVPTIVHHRIDAFYIDLLRQRECVILPE